MLEIDRKPERKSNKSKTENRKWASKITRDKPKEEQTNEQRKAERGSDSGS